MSIMDKYELVSMVGAGEANAFRAREISTGRAVLVHQFSPGTPTPGGTDLMSMVCKYLGRADAPGIENFLDSAEEDERVFIVTVNVPECLNLRQWLESMAIAFGDAVAPGEPAAAEPGGAEAGLSPQESSPPAATQGEPSELSQILGTLSDHTPAAESSGPSQQGAPPLDSYAPTVVISVKPPGSPAPGKAGPPPGSEGKAAPPAQAPSPQPPPAAGEFTKMFNAPRTSQPPGKGATAPPPVVPAGKEPGEFTLMFSATGQQRSKPEAPLPTSGKTPGPLAEAGEPGHPQQPPTFAATPAEPNGPGEFTQMFKTGGEPPPRPGVRAPAPSSLPLSSSSKGPSEFTMLIQGQKPAATKPPRAILETPKPVAPPVEDSSPKGPGEFTMLFQRPPQPAPPAAAPPVAPPPVVKPAPPPPPTPQAGEYTRMFEAPRPPAGALTPTAAAPPPGYKYPAAPAPPPVPQAPAFKAPAPAPPMPSVQAPTYPAPPAYAAPQPAYPPMQPPAIQPPPAPQPALPAEAKKPPIFWILLLALGCLFLTAVVLVLLLALKH